ncbi:MAG: AMP-binding protein [Rhodobacteraceae bacterium]|nr:AMP-binding protein [Paracoccaceae bacterium]
MKDEWGMTSPGAVLAPRNGESYVRGPVEPPLTDITVSALLAQAVERFGEREAVVFAEQDIRFSYSQFSRRIDDVARGFLALGLSQGDRVGIWSPNRVEWVLTQFATARVGLILVNINPAYRPAELEFALNKVGCKALVAAARFRNSDYVSMLRQVAPELDDAGADGLNSARLPALRHVILTENCAGCIPFDDLARLGRDVPDTTLAEIEASLSPDDAINIQFTSGTTGSPKGATLTHNNIVNNARFVTDRIRLTETDRLALPVPLYHCFGMVMGVLGAVSKGAAMIFPAAAFDAVRTLDILQSERCTAAYGVPTMFLAMLDEIRSCGRDLSALRTGIMAGAPCPIEIMRRVNTELNMREITICYGMTETSPVSFQSFVDDTVEQRCRTVGRVHPHIEVKLVDDRGEITPVGARGELCTRGYSVMQGYWNDAAQTEACMRDGWLHTGDLAVFDGDGFCSIVGRVKDMIIRGGENIYPREIEELLIGLEQVHNAQVFGISDEKFGEIVCAWVIPEPGISVTVDELRRELAGRIAHFKIPEHIRFVDELPMTITGKPQKFIMRDRMQAELAK